MWVRCLVSWGLALAAMTTIGLAQSPSPNGVKTLDPPGAIKVEGTWSLGARAGDFIFVAGMQGIDRATNMLVQDPQARIRQALLNIRLIAQSEGAGLQDCVRLTVYVSDLHRFAPMVDKAQAELVGPSRPIRPLEQSRDGPDRPPLRHDPFEAFAGVPENHEAVLFGVPGRCGRA
jgi:2-iminobutanoate/2-iminopropanoate deaminase